MSQLACGSRGPQPPRSSITQTVKMMQQKKRPVQLSIPPPEEENLWVKCKNCSAYGHNARSKKCPIKSCQGSVILMPLGLKKEKMKNQKSLNRQESRPLNQAVGHKEQTRWLAEQQGKAVLPQVPRSPQEEKEQHNWPEVMESCNYLRQPTRPTLYHGKGKRSIPNLIQESQSLANKAYRTPTRPLVPPTQGPTLAISQGYSPGQQGVIQGKSLLAVRHLRQDPALHVELTEQGTVGQVVDQAATKMHSMGQVVWQPRPAQSPEEKQLYLPETVSRECHESKTPGKRAALGPMQTGQNPRKKQRLLPSPSPGHNTGGAGLSVGALSMSTLDLQASPQANKQRAGQVASSQLQPLPDFLPMQSDQPHTGTQNRVSSHCSGQPLRMVLTRLHHDTWTSRFLIIPSSHSPEKAIPSASKLLMLGKAEGHSSVVSHRVLHEDLRLSEESDIKSAFF